MMTKDNQQRFYLTLGSNRGMSIRDEMDNFLKTTKRLPYFKSVKQTTPLLQNLSFTPVHIRFGYTFTGFGGDALYFHIANITSVLGKHVTPPFSLTHVDFDNTAAAPKLTLALGKSVSHIQQIVGQKYVLSLSRNSEGVFAIHLNSVLVFSHTDNRPFHRINGDKKPEYRFGGTHFAQDTTLRFYCQLHFAKDLSEDMIKRIHAELMTHYFI